MSLTQVYRMCPAGVPLSTQASTAGKWGTLSKTSWTAVASVAERAPSAGLIGISGASFRLSRQSSGGDWGTAGDDNVYGDIYLSAV